MLESDKVLVLCARIAMPSKLCFEILSHYVRIACARSPNKKEGSVTSAVEGDNR